MSTHSHRPHHGLATGYSDGLEALEPLDVGSLGTCDELLRRMARTAFGGRSLGEAAEILVEMVEDPDCWVVGTFSGAMTVAKQGLLIVEMIERGMLNAIVSTGALMTHGLVEGQGMKHFKYRPGMDDVELFEKGYDRVYDTLELEGNLDATERVVRDVLRGWDPARTLSSRALLEELGQYLLDHQLGPAVLASAKKHGVPVYVPAFTDSEMGLDVALFNEARTEAGEKSLDFNPFLDLDDFRRRAVGQKKLGIFTIGGGVPRNWAQQVACYEDLRRARLGKEGEEPVRYRYGIRICPEPVHWGGLSGCTYSEGVSWGKFVPEAEGGRFAEVMADATIAWPLLLRGVIERLAGAGTASRPR